MTNNIHKNIRLIIPGLILFSVLTTVDLCYAQDADEKNESFVGLNYSQSPASRKITATLTARIKGERGRSKVADGEIEFINLVDNNPVVLGTSKTNNDGIAELELSTLSIMPNAEGDFVYGAAYKGDSKFDAAEKELTIKNITLDISFVDIDSVKTIVASAFHTNTDGGTEPVDEEVSFYVPREFSLIKVGQVDLEEGQGSINFPITLPGDSAGYLQIIARIEESDDYGTVETTGIKEWGKPRPPVVIEKRRGLGDTDAPLWMVYTLIVLLSIVWFHYLYIVFVLFIQIKRKGLPSKTAV